MSIWAFHSWSMIRWCWTDKRGGSRNEGESEENTGKSMDGKMDERLMRLALAARERSYSPYSHFRVGRLCSAATAACTPAVISRMRPLRRGSAPSGQPSDKAVSEGRRELSGHRHRGRTGGRASGPLPLPAASAVRSWREFCDPESFRILLGAGTDETQEFRLKELLPFGFGPGDLKEECEG